MKLEVATAIFALQAQDAPALASCIFTYFDLPALELEAITRGTGMPRAGIIVLPDAFTSYAFGELGGPSRRHWGFSSWSFSVRDPLGYPYLLFT